jgi:hypothetical protein
MASPVISRAIPLRGRRNPVALATSLPKTSTVPGALLACLPNKKPRPFPASWVGDGTPVPGSLATQYNVDAVENGVQLCPG